ncbi:MAG: hypothetical protein AB8I08_32545 [Sandaracinaceae bacterium]
MSEVASRLLALGLKWYRRGALEEARELLRGAQEVAELHGLADVEGRAWTHLGRASSLTCEPKLAERAFGEAARCFRASGDAGAAAMALLRQAFMAYDAGDHAGSATLLTEVEGQSPSEANRAIAIGYRGNLARAQGQLDEADARYRSAVEQLVAADVPLYAATFEMDIAVVALLRSEVGEALAALDRGRSHAATTDREPMLDALLSHYNVLALATLGDLEPVVAAIAAHEAPDSVAMRFLAKTHGWVEGAVRAPSPAHRERLIALGADAPTYAHARLTLRLLQQLAGGSSTRADRLCIDAGRRRVWMDGRVETRFVKGSAEWRILLALAAHRASDAPGALTSATLLESGWPGARLTPSSARNRLHVALSALRKRGLRDVLIRHPDGYALSRLVSVVHLASER